MSEAERSEVERYRAALALAALPAPQVFETARESLGDDVWRVRRAAWEAVCRSSAPWAQIIAFFIECLEDSDNAGLRGAAGEALAAYGAEAVPSISQALAGLSTRGKKAALDLLVQIGDPGASEAALQALQSDSDENVRFSAAELLGEVGSTDIAGQLLAWLGKTKGSDRFAVLSALVRLARRGRLAASIDIGDSGLEESLNDSVLCIPAIQLIGCAGNDASLVVLWDMIQAAWPLDDLIMALGEGLERRTELQLTDEGGKRLQVVHERITSANASLSLRRAGFVITALVSPAALSKIIDLLLDDDESVSWLSERLQVLSSSVLRPILTALVHHRNGKELAAELLAERPELDGESVLLSMLSESGPHRRTTLAALGSIGSLRAVPHLISACGDGDGTIKEAAAESLFSLAKKRIPGMAELLAMGVSEWRSEVITLLMPAVGRLSSEQAVPILTQAMRSAEPQVRRAAVQASSDFAETPDIIRLLQARLADEDDEVRSAAATALGASRNAQSAELLTVLLEDANPWVQAAALRALSELGTLPTRERFVELLRRGGVVATAAAWAAGQHVCEELFEVLVEAVGSLDDYPTAELLKSLALYERELKPTLLAAMLSHPAWPVRAAAASYIAHRKADWMVELARERMVNEDDGLVRMHLARLAGE